MNKLLSGRRVLVVEDEMLVLMNIEDMLADLGCNFVSAAATINQALELIDAQPFDVATLDMNLKGDKSHAVADALTARGVPFLFATGYDAHYMPHGYRDQPLLKKPFSLEELASMLTRLLSKRDVSRNA